MHDAPRYRLNAAECLIAANACHGDYRGLLVSIAASWRALARYDEAMEVLASWVAAVTDRETGQVLACRASPTVSEIKGKLAVFRRQ
jgi:hypothetical protein